MYRHALPSRARRASNNICILYMCEPHIQSSCKGVPCRVCIKLRQPRCSGNFGASRARCCRVQSARVSGNLRAPFFDLLCLPLYQNLTHTCAHLGVKIHMSLIRLCKCMFIRYKNFPKFLDCLQLNSVHNFRFKSNSNIFSDIFVSYIWIYLVSRIMFWIHVQLGNKSLKCNLKVYDRFMFNHKLSSKFLSFQFIDFQFSRQSFSKFLDSYLIFKSGCFIRIRSYSIIWNYWQSYLLFFTFLRL